MNKNELGLYIHVPFCKSKCYYCDFNSHANSEDLVPGYFDALKREIRLYSEKLKGFKIKTIFIGGGTPSLVEPKYVYETINLCRQSFDIASNAEISLESNPGTLTYEKLVAYKVMGINRLSMGLQCWQDNLLKDLGRIHTRDEFVENYNQARKAGFKNINVDLIFGLPGQSLGDWAQTIANVVKLEPEHLSCYSLKIEDDTVFGKRYEEGKLIPASDELDREMYYLAIENLGKSGNKHYEISNFAKEGCECRHNIIYWKAEPYVGIGAGAHSYFDGKRYNNVYGIKDYTQTVNKKGIPRENIEKISKEESMSEYIILGMRLIDGISPEEFRSSYEVDIFDVFGQQINKLLKKQLIEYGEGKLKLSPLGLDLANEVFVEFI